jgi:hypothetical protein
MIPTFLTMVNGVTATDQVLVVGGGTGGLAALMVRLRPIHDYRHIDRLYGVTRPGGWAPHAA